MASFLPGAHLRAETLTPGEADIKRLIEFVRDSHLTFIRNGERHDSNAAADHLGQKYERMRSRVLTPHEFIDKVASKSWLSGEPYLVELADGTTRPVSALLNEQLEKWEHSIK
jgi:hypothetical protein